MTKELVISSNRHQTKLAILEDDQLVEVYFQRSNEYSLAGSIHKGRVTRVLPGMQSAFVDLGLERDTFLYVSDFFEGPEDEDYDRVTGGDERSPRGERGPSRNIIVAAPASEPEPAATTASEPAASTEAAAQPRFEENGRDRRGRRPRRRRRGGRGFPESKYAAEPPSGSTAGEPAETAEEVKAAEPEDLLVLPGESLAKYRHPDSPEETSELPAAPESADEEPAETAAADETEESSEEAAEAGEEEEAELSQIPVEVKASAAPHPSGSDEHEPGPEEFNPYDKPHHYPPDNAEPDAPGHDDDVAAAQPAPSAAPAPAPAVKQPPAGTESDVSAEAEEETAIRDEPDDEEDREMQALILEAHEGEETGSQTAGEPAGETAGEPLHAAVREQGGRYLHRVSRRMRRRLRSESRTESAPPPQAPPPPPPHRTVTRPDKGAAPSITELLKEGQEIIVQIAKEPLGQKGARITSHVALPGRYVVFMPTLDHMGVSRKISSDEERLRLKRILQGHRTEFTGGFITRTAAEGRTEDEILADMRFLYNLWLDIKHKAEKHPAPLLLHHDLDIVQRTLRDQLTESFKSIWVDNEEIYESTVRFVERFQPALVNRVKLYTRSTPIFDAFNITSEMEKALRPKVWLKSGGYIVINQTEALVAIDVNTGKFVGKSNRLEDTIVKTNTEAIKEIVRQIRLRDLGGIIVIDFIDMDERKNRQKVMQALEEAMRADRAPYKILQFNDFGLVAITRKRVKQSLERTLCSPCPHCEGAGYVKSVQTVISEILTEAQKMAASVEGMDVVLRVHPDVAKVLKSHQTRYLEELEEILQRPVLVKGDPLLHHEKFDLA